MREHKREENMRIQKIYHDILEKLGQSMNLTCMTPVTAGSEDLKSHPVFTFPTPSWRGWEVVSSWGPGELWHKAACSMSSTWWFSQLWARSQVIQPEDDTGTIEFWEKGISASFRYAFYTLWTSLVYYLSSNRVVWLISDKQTGTTGFTWFFIFSFPYFMISEILEF